MKRIASISGPKEKALVAPICRFQSMLERQLIADGAIAKARPTAKVRNP